MEIPIKITFNPINPTIIPWNSKISWNLIQWIPEKPLWQGAHPRLRNAWEPHDWHVRLRRRSLHVPRSKEVDVELPCRFEVFWGSIGFLEIQEIISNPNISLNNFEILEITYIINICFIPINQMSRFQGVPIEQSTVEVLNPSGFNRQCPFSNCHSLRDNLPISRENCNDHHPKRLWESCAPPLRSSPVRLWDSCWINRSTASWSKYPEWIGTCWVPPKIQWVLKPVFLFIHGQWENHTNFWSNPKLWTFIAPINRWSSRRT